jgi:hypothetical protein
VTRTTKITVIAAVAATAVLLVVALADVRPNDDRAWVEQFPTFEQLPQRDWELVEDHVRSGYVLIRLQGWSETTAQREAVYVVDRDVDQIASHIDEKLGIEAPHTPVEQYGASWVARWSPLYEVATYGARASDKGRKRSASVDVRPDTRDGRTRVTIKASVSLR